MTSLLLAAALAAWGPDIRPGTVSGGIFTPGRPGVARFGDDPAVVCPDTSLARSIKDQVDELSRASKRPPPLPDGRLCLAAEALLGWDQKQEVRLDAKAFLSQYFGLTTTVNRVSIATIPTDDPKVLAERLIEPLGNFALNASSPRYGYATQRGSATFDTGARGVARTATRVILLLQDAPLSLEPVPRRLAKGETARIAGKLLGEATAPRVLTSDVMGKMSTVPAASGTAFEAKVACGETPGRIQVEITAERAGETFTAARFPVACGIELAKSIPVVDPDPWPADPPAQEKKMLALLNAERTAVGLKALEWDDALAGVARGVAEAVRETRTVPGDFQARLRKAGVVSRLVLENPAQARDIEEAHEQLLASPVHRENVMNPEVTHGGVGIAPEAGKDGPSVFVAQVFALELAAQDPEAVRKQLREAAARRRKDARLPALASDPALEEVAQKVAAETAAAGGDLPKARRDALFAPLNKAYRSIAMTPPGARADFLDVAEEPEVASPGKFLGVGAALGMHPTLGRNAVYAVILVGQKR